MFQRFREYGLKNFKFNGSKHGRKNNNGSFSILCKVNLQLLFFFVSEWRVIKFTFLSTRKNSLNIFVYNGFWKCKSDWSDHSIYTKKITEKPLEKMRLWKTRCGDTIISFIFKSWRDIDGRTEKSARDPTVFTKSVSHQNVVHKS